VHNKIDLAGVGPRVDANAVYLSARTGAGVELLRKRLLEHAGWHSGEESVFIARERHLVALRRAVERLEAASSQLAAPELFAEELRLAQAELGAITGAVTADDLLGEIFARFCIGK
jgi:tRNA modification GTPase